MTLRIFLLTATTSDPDDVTTAGMMQTQPPPPRTTLPPPPTPLTTYILIGVSAVLVIVIALGIVGYCYWMRKRNNIQSKTRVKNSKIPPATFSMKFGRNYASIKNGQEESTYATIHESGYEVPIPMSVPPSKKSSMLSRISNSVFRKNTNRPLPSTIAAPSPAVEVENSGYEVPMTLMRKTQTENLQQSSAPGEDIKDGDYIDFFQGQTSQSMHASDTKFDSKAKRNMPMTKSLYLSPLMPKGSPVPNVPKQQE